MDTNSWLTLYALADLVLGSSALMTQGHQATTTKVLKHQIPSGPTARFPADPQIAAFTNVTPHLGFSSPAAEDSIPTEPSTL